ncbi:MAG TPA: MupG family TIM beta-alpha barrel fold protein [Caproiciproducens sp.]|nr:MupG family TIM beta-alpha barrel fold protein [Caproiciproducens sp.]
MKEFGISLYLGTGFEKNAAILEKARRAGIRYAFTSLHIPEESSCSSEQEIKKLFRQCESSGISLIADIGPRTIEKLGYHSLSDLKKAPISCLRVDYGFTCEQIIDLSKDFNLIFNASTLQEDQITQLKNLHADFSKFSACHNFYPKPLTGLSLSKVQNINDRMHRLGMKTIAFAAGDSELRGPLKMGLPTVEEQRNGNVLLNILQLIRKCATDVCIIGDIDISDKAYRQIRELSEGYVRLQAEIRPEYGFIADTVHHDRPDSSDYVIRSQESRTYASQGKFFPAEPCQPREKGSISIGNEKYLRYSGELEVARINLPPESKVNIVGRIKPESIPYLEYITDGMGFQLDAKSPNP